MSDNNPRERGVQARRESSGVALAVFRPLQFREDSRVVASDASDGGRDERPFVDNRGDVERGSYAIIHTCVHGSKSKRLRKEWRRQKPLSVPMSRDLRPSPQRQNCTSRLAQEFRKSVSNYQDLIIGSAKQRSS